MIWLREGTRIRNKVSNRIGILKQISDMLWEIKFEDDTYALVYTDQIQTHYEPIQLDRLQSFFYMKNRSLVCHHPQTINIQID